MEDSVDSYGLTVRNSMEQEETSIVMETESKPTEWTDEKHFLFLKSMESTFVNQLYKSIELFGWHSHKNFPSGSKTSKHKQTSIRSASGQFKVLRDGCWSKIDFRRDEPEADQEEESKVPLANPWIKHYRNSKIQVIKKFPASFAKAPLATTENQNPAHNFYLRRQGSSTEAMGQNFNDKALEEEKSGTIHEMKRTRTVADIVSSNDQVVPSDNIGQVGDAVEHHVHHPPPEGP